jgi:hypothetical protein
MEKTLAAITEVLGRLPVQALMTLGHVRGVTANAPPNVTVVRSAPQSALLPNASAVVLAATAVKWITSHASWDQRPPVRHSDLLRQAMVGGGFP